MGVRLQICVRMTDGISLALSSHCLSNKGLIEGAEAPTSKRRRVRDRRRELDRDHMGEELERGTARGQPVKLRADTVHTTSRGRAPACYQETSSAGNPP